MQYEDLTPEQKAKFEEAVKISRSNMRHIIVPNLLLLLALQIVNVFICSRFALPSPSPFFIYFFTTFLIFSVVNVGIREESDRFQEEAFKIFDNKQ